MRKLLQTAFLLILILVTAACTEVKFRNIQPSNASILETFPDSLEGIYLNQDGDTLMISEKNISLVNRASECNPFYEHDSLGQDILLTFFKGSYLLNIQEDSLWTLALIRHPNQKMLDVSLIDGEDLESLETLSQITLVDTIFSEDGEVIHFIIDPDSTILLEIIQHGLFSDHYQFKRID
ncbi:MAG: hypothetical protein P8100_01460 [bacterium]